MVLKLPTLKSAAVGFGSDRKNESFERLRKKAGVAKYEHKELVFD